MRTLLPGRHRGSFAIAAVGAAAVTAAVVVVGDTAGRGVAAASLASPLPGVTLTQMDGTPPFDPSDSTGGDADPSNGVVRSGDRVAFVVDIDPGTAGLRDAVVTIPIWQGLVLDAVPAFCGPGSTLLPAGVLTVLTCDLGDLAPRKQTTRVVTATASAAAGPSSGAITTGVTLTGTSPLTLVTSNTTQLTFVARPEGCDPAGAGAAQEPAERPTANRVQAVGRIADVVVDDAGDPVPGAVVTLRGEDRCGDRIERRATASESGRFAFVGLVAGLYTVTASAPDDAPGAPSMSATVPVTLSDANTTVSGLDLRIPAESAVAEEPDVVVEER
ncbi:carboxypeptidase-like regulatory domain-containing protein [Prescottella sp. R16]|uniref:carboxypeptidase-like regulatory domain-containing protein n=1 Tax=Prescottella sp. R16 TaxID=3064529 RepID=UPI00272E7A90|nr:carboxypeptidase-like regulatory domain-containing protein [Prescottella sp. R16]